jgi:hypothetical protein
VTFPCGYHPGSHCVGHVAGPLPPNDPIPTAPGGGAAQLDGLFKSQHVLGSGNVLVPSSHGWNGLSRNEWHWLAVSAVAPQHTLGCAWSAVQVGTEPLMSLGLTGTSASWLVPRETDFPPQAPSIKSAAVSAVRFMIV